MSQAARRRAGASEGAGQAPPAEGEAGAARGKPDAALAYLAQPEVRTRTGRGLAVIARFAERWLAVRSKTLAP